MNIDAGTKKEPHTDTLLAGQRQRNVHFAITRNENSSGTQKL